MSTLISDISLPAYEEYLESFEEWKNNQQSKSLYVFEKDLYGWYANDETHSAQRELLQLVKKLK